VPDVERLRATCERHLSLVPIPQPFNLRRYCDLVATHRGREIRLMESDGPFTEDHPSGAWSPLADEDHIYYVSGLAPVHRAQIVLHEVGHMMFGHDPTLIFTDEENVKKITPDLRPAALRRMLFRTSFTERPEREAEMYASLVMERAGIGAPAPQTARHGELVNRLAEAIGHPVRREGVRHG
jgi:hypothetical protein